MKVLTPRQFRNVADKTGHDPVEFTILAVNNYLTNPKVASAKGPKCLIHHILGIPLRLTVEQMFEVRARCLASGWKSVKVIVWEQTTAVTMHATAVYDWTCAMDGKTLDEPLSA